MSEDNTIPLSAEPISKLYEVEFESRVNHCMSSIQQHRVGQASSELPLRREEVDLGLRITSHPKHSIESYRSFYDSKLDSLRRADDCLSCMYNSDAMSEFLRRFKTLANRLTDESPTPIHAPFKCDDAILKDSFRATYPGGDSKFALNMRLEREVLLQSYFNARNFFSQSQPEMLQRFELFCASAGTPDRLEEFCLQGVSYSGSCNRFKMDPDYPVEFSDQRTAKGIVIYCQLKKLKKTTPVDVVCCGSRI